MQRVLKRFYLILSLAVLVATLVFFINLVPIKTDNGVTNIMMFATLVLMYVLMSGSLLLMEHKLFYNLKTSYFSHGLILIIFFINFLLYTKVLFIILLVLLILVLLLKTYYYQTIKSKFQVKDFNVIPKVYFINLLVVAIINLLTTDYISSIFLLMPVLLLEVEVFMKIKLEKANYEYNLIGSLSLIVSVFFLSYYSDLFTNNFDIIYNILFPAASLFLVFVMFNLMNKKALFIIKTSSIE